MKIRSCYKCILVLLMSYGFSSFSFATDIINLIKLFEGSHKQNDMHVAYICPAGVKTIAWGLTNVKKTSLTEDEADALLRLKIMETNKCIDRHVKVHLSDNQRTALISFIFNIGNSAFLRSNVYKAIKSHRLADVPKELLKWKYITKGKKQVVSRGLHNRRLQEIKLWNS